jgi:hypothetical protein
LHDQLEAELPASGNRRGLVLSASKEVEPGARAMLLLAEGLFRLDAAITGDTLRTVVRNLSAGELDLDNAPGEGGLNVAFGEVAAYEPSRTELRFSLGTGDDRVSVKVTIATLKLAERGTIRITAQAIVRQAPAA